MKSQLLLTIILLIISLEINAEITTDGSLGSHANLPGPDYLIGADLGRQIGSNLFHSFQDFNLNSSESATFSGPSNVQNILSRVTGGNPSNIDGLIRSTIPNADFYFLNPYGIMFGENAKLDVQGSFHASTADYLRLGITGQFAVNHPEQSILTVAPPTAFGFLDAPAGIQVQGSKFAIAPWADFSLIGGDLTFNNAQLLASSGRFNLISIAAKGEVTAKESHLDIQVPDTSSFAKFGHIEMINSYVETSGSPASGINISAAQFLMHNSSIYAHTLLSDSDSNSKDIDILATEWIRIQGEPSEISESEYIVDTESGIFSNTFSNGNASHIFITTPQLEISKSTIDTSTRSKGNGGNIEIQSQQIRFREGAAILSNAYGAGVGGQIKIKAMERLELIDQRVFLTPEEIKLETSIQANTFGSGNSGSIFIEAGYLQLWGADILSQTFNEGDGNQIFVKANNIDILNGSSISVSAVNQAIGNGGNLYVNVADTLQLSGFRPGFLGSHNKSNIFHKVQSSLVSVTLGSGVAGAVEISAKNLVVSDYGSVGAATVGSGHAGNLAITVDNLYLKNGGILSNSSGGVIGENLILGTGDAGDITVTAKGDIVIEGHNPLYPSGIISNTFFSGQGGNIRVQTNRLAMRDEGTISASSLGTGNAGNIQIKANQISLLQGSKIASAATQAIGGNITVNAPYLLYLQKSHITTSVHGGTGNGGNITIENPAFVILNQGNIIAQADEGYGGDIYIKSGQFVESSNSLVSASSNLGIDGEVNIDSPDMDMEGFLVVLPEEFIDVSNLMTTHCNQRLSENLSNFVVKSSEGSPNSPDDLLPSGPLLSDSLPIKMTTSIKNPSKKLPFSTNNCKRGKLK
jgi:filamentous hemagglutinin family protein